VNNTLLLRHELDSNLAAPQQACVRNGVDTFISPPFLSPARRHVSFRYCIPDTFILHDTCKQGCTISAHRRWEAV